MNSIIDGWLDKANRVLSPNCDDRPDLQVISLIVIHCISLPPGEFGGGWIDRLFTNTLPLNQHEYFDSIQSLKVSAHILVDRNGSFTQYVPFHRRAWHAGVSSYCGKERCNDFSIGIELEGTETTDYTDAQYQSLAELIECLLAHYPSLSKQRIAAHSELAPGRKTDPGESFDWLRLKMILS